MRTSRTACLLLFMLSFSIDACASGVGSDDVTPDAGAGDAGFDAEPFDSGELNDAGTDAGTDTGADAGTDAGRDIGTDMPMGGSCGTTTCMPFEFCANDQCMPYPACPDGTCAESADICRSGHCVPRTSDIDGDGSTAETDCDETNPAVHPGAPEVCNGIDDNCNNVRDDGPPACPAGYTGCVSGSCQCPSEFFDLDGMTSNGCECAAIPAPGIATSCAGAQNLGGFVDTGSTMMVVGNAIPAGREDWYHFLALDSLDGAHACDLFNVHIFFAANPNAAFEFTVFRGMCSTVECGDTGFTDYTYSMHLREGTGTSAVGECPCSPTGTTMDGENENDCTNDSDDFYVRVRRRVSTVTCDLYTLQITNGL